ncbi:single-stranded DNA-binding protein, partial [Endozoicomonas acroporae]
KWQDQNGQDRYQTEVVYSGYNGKLLFLEKNPNGQQAQPAQSQYQPAQPNQYANAREGVHAPQPMQTQQYDSYDDSIPF